MTLSNNPQPLARILYVEDNALNVRLVRKSLGHMGYDVLHACDGPDGISMAQIEQPDLILMDIDLPEMDGIETRKHLLQMPDVCHIPVVALTADATAETRHLCEINNFTAYLEKPVSRSLLLKTVNRVLNETPVRISS